MEESGSVSIQKMIERCAGTAHNFFDEIEDDDDIDKNNQGDDDDNNDNVEFDDDSSTSSDESDDFEAEPTQVAAV